MRPSPSISTASNRHAGRLRWRGEKVTRGRESLPRLRAVMLSAAPPKCWLAALTHFDEHDGCAVQQHEVDLAQAASVVARLQPQALAWQVGQREILGLDACAWH